MLTDLRVSGLALLEDCELELGSGLTAITGETGAGKTMLLTALRLLTGGRAEPRIIKTGRGRTEVDAVISVPTAVANDLEEAGFQVDEGEVAFARTVTPSRSRAAISGRPVPARALADTAGSLITIHGQADQWRLKSPTHQRELLDRYAPPPHDQLLADYQRQWATVTNLRARTAQLEADKDRLEVELRYLREVTDEVAALDPSPDEEVQLDSAIDRLSNVEQLRAASSGALATLMGEGFGSEAAVADLLGSVVDVLLKASYLDPQLEEYSRRAQSMDAEINELISDLRDYGEVLFDDPDELARLHERRATLTELCRGRARDAAELLAWCETAKTRIGELEGVEGDPQAARLALDAAEQELQKLAENLSASRWLAAEDLGKKVNGELAALALANARVIVEVSTTELSASGQDRVQMLLQPHPNAPATPLDEGASGGELSRIMLAIEVVLATDQTPQTMVFDEVDAGIGGLTANQVGARLKALADFHQVIVVTHLPQVAALADANFVVEKSDGTARVRPVSNEDKTDEIVRMLGGDDKEGAARRHALKLERAGNVEESTS